MNGPLKAGVAGAGVFGGHHARKLASLPGVELVGVYDRGTGRAAALAEQLGAPAFLDLEAFLDRAGAVTVAAPAVAHFELAWAALCAGRHVYAEKPLAAVRFSTSPSRRESASSSARTARSVLPSPAAISPWEA